MDSFNRQLGSYSDSNIRKFYNIINIKAKYHFLGNCLIYIIIWDSFRENDTSHI